MRNFTKRFRGNVLTSRLQELQPCSACPSCSSEACRGVRAGGWHFVSLPPEIDSDIADVTAGIRAGFGSVRVAATVGTTSWRRET